MTGTFGGALVARKIPADGERLYSETRGEVEAEDGVLVIRRIHITYHLQIAQEHRETAERVLGFHAKGCPVYRTISGCVDVTTSLVMEDVPAE